MPAPAWELFLVGTNATIPGHLRHQAPLDLGKPTRTLVSCWMPKPLPPRNQCTGWFAPTTPLARERTPIINLGVMKVMLTWIFVILTGALSHWFPTKRSSHVGADMTAIQWRRPSRRKMWSSPRHSKISLPKGTALLSPGAVRIRIPPLYEMPTLASNPTHCKVANSIFLKILTMHCHNGSQQRVPT